MLVALLALLAAPSAVWAGGHSYRAGRSRSRRSSSSSSVYGSWRGYVGDAPAATRVTSYHQESPSGWGGIYCGPNGAYQYQTRCEGGCPRIVYISKTYCESRYAVMKTLFGNEMLEIPVDYVEYEDADGCSYRYFAEWECIPEPKKGKNRPIPGKYVQPAPAQSADTPAPVVGEASPVLGCCYNMKNWYEKAMKPMKDADRPEMSRADCEAYNDEYAWFEEKSCTEMDWYDMHYNSQGCCWSHKRSEYTMSSYTVHPGVDPDTGMMEAKDCPTTYDFTGGIGHEHLRTTFEMGVSCQESSAAPQLYPETDDFANIKCAKENGHCVDERGARVTEGRVKLDVTGSYYNFRDPHTQKKCEYACRRYEGATGCEVIWDHADQGCYVHTGAVTGGSGSYWPQCWVFSKCAAAGEKYPRKETTCENGIYTNSQEDAALNGIYLPEAEQLYGSPVMKQRDADNAHYVYYCPRTERWLVATAEFFAQTKAESDSYSCYWSSLYEGFSCKGGAPVYDLCAVEGEATKVWISGAITNNKYSGPYTFPVVLDGFFVADETKMLKGAPTFWREDGEMFIYFCDLSGRWHLENGSRWDASISWDQCPKIYESYNNHLPGNWGSYVHKKQCDKPATPAPVATDCTAITDGWECNNNHIFKKSSVDCYWINEECKKAPNPFNPCEHRTYDRCSEAKPICEWKKPNRGGWDGWFDCVDICRLSNTIGKCQLQERCMWRHNKCNWMGEFEVPPLVPAPPPPPCEVKTKKTCKEREHLGCFWDSWSWKCIETEPPTPAPVVEGQTPAPERADCAGKKKKTCKQTEGCEFKSGDCFNKPDPGVVVCEGLKKGACKKLKDDCQYSNKQCIDKVAYDPTECDNLGKKECKEKKDLGCKYKKGTCSFKQPK